MFTFLQSRQPKPPVVSEKQGDDHPPTTDIAVVSTPAQAGPGLGAPRPHAQPTDGPEARTSSASIPTIDSTPTLQGPPADASPTPAASLAPPSSGNTQGSASLDHTHSSIQSDRPMQSQSQPALPYSPPAVANQSGKDPRGFSLPSFAFLRPDAKQNKNKTRPIPPPLQIQAISNVSRATENKPKPSRTFFSLGSAASSEKRAKESAAIIRSVIVGDHNTPPDVRSNKTKSVSKADVARVKAQLLNPKTAAKLIAQLRTLPAHPNDATTSTKIPIRAVCLDMSDKDAHEQHFAQLQPVASASVSAIYSALAGMHLVDLVTAPNMGFGAPVTAQGLFAGSVPTPETVITGIEQITPQLMALGYATGKAILPDHKGVIVPTDRISVLTYWWGLEVCLPPPTMAHLEAAESPGSALLNLLTAISILNEGVREILPFIRYIAQFVQTEWSMIKRADEGKGVVCTATWLLPIALVPRPWDFPDPPPHAETGAAGQATPTPTSPSVNRFSTNLTTPKPSTEVPNGGARASFAYSTETRDEEDSRPIISSEPPVLPELVVSSPGSIDGAPPENVDRDVHNAHGSVQHDGAATAH